MEKKNQKNNVYVGQYRGSKMVSEKYEEKNGKYESHVYVGYVHIGMGIHRRVY